jgi:NodT family efflux transporter outer membrane factor (OMF) lipoprotein
MRRARSGAGSAWVTAAILALAACSLAPEYHRPSASAPPDFKEAGAWKTAEPADELPKGAWWRRLGDPVLDQLEDKIAGANQSLKSALARFEQARAAVQIAHADQLPQITANPSATRQKGSSTIANPFKRVNFSDYVLSAGVSYEIDVWGRVRNSVESAKDKAQASAGDLAATDLDLRAALAEDYFALRGFDTQQRILDETVSAFAAALDLTGRRHDGGVQPIADVAQAEGQVETAKTQAADNLLRRAQMEHAIAILVGEPPAEFSLPPRPLEGEPPPSIAAGLPSQLIERRPDVAAAERRVAAANADIGVARAAFFPVFTLDGLIGVESALPQKWLRAPSSIWSFGPSAMIYLFDGGRRDALSDQALAAYDETVADYRQTVLTANAEVEDNLAALRLLDREAQTQRAAVTATKQALAQAKLRYTAGLVTYIEVVETENLALAAELSAADIETRRMTATVLLIRALGGGWEAETGLDLQQAAGSVPANPAAEP